MIEDHEVELDEMVAMLESAGLLIQTTEDGKPALQLTPKGAQVATQMAKGHEDDAFAVFNRCWMPRRPTRRPARLRAESQERPAPERDGPLVPTG